MVDPNYVRSLCGHYPYSQDVMLQIVPVLDRFDTLLTPQKTEFIHNDGRVEIVVVLIGVLPVKLRGATYNCPVSIYLPLKYPREAPIVYVTPTKTMEIRRKSTTVDANGRVVVQYLGEWERKPEAFNLATLIDILQDEFGKSYPLVSVSNRQPSAQSKAVPAYTPATSSGYTTPSPGYASPPPSHSGPPPVPQRPDVYMNAGQHPSASPAPYASPVAPQKPTPYYPNAYPLPPPVSYLQGQMQNLQLQHGPQSPVQTAQPQGSEGIALGRLGVAGQAVQPGYSLPQAYPQQSLPYAANPTPQAAPPNGTHARQRSVVPNLMDDDQETQPATVAPSTHGAPPAVPPNPEVLRLRAEVHAKLLAKREAKVRTIIAETERQKVIEHDLLKGVPAMEDEMQRLKVVKDVCDSVFARYRETRTESEKTIERYNSLQPGPDIDELASSTSVVHHQLLDLVSEDMGLQDTMYALSRAFNDNGNRNNSQNVDTFIKTTRSLARRQFMVRELVNKILAGL